MKVIHYTVEVMKVTNYTGLWDTELAWYSPSTTRWICFYGLEYNNTIHAFRSTWPLPERRGSCPLNENSSTIWLQYCDKQRFRLMFFFFFLVASEDVFELVKHKFQNRTTLDVHVRGFQIAHGVKQCTACQHTNFHDTSNHSGHLLWFELLWSRDIRAESYHVSKYGKILRFFTLVKL